MDVVAQWGSTHLRIGLQGRHAGIRDMGVVYDMNTVSKFLTRVECHNRPK
jgi:hypothetical protein